MTFVASFACSVKNSKAISDPTVSVIPQTIDWSGNSVNDTFSVEITISSPDIPIWSGGIGIGFNPNVLECVNFSKGSAIKSTWLWIPGTINNNEGYVSSSGWSCIVGQEPGWTGNDTFIIYTFLVRNNGNSTLDLTTEALSPYRYYKTELSKKIGSSIIEITPIVVCDGFFANGEATQPLPKKHDIAIRYIKCLQSVAYVGDIVKIEVGVENTGDFTESFNVTLYADKNIDIVFDEYMLGIIQVAEMQPKTTEVLLFEWNTIGMLIGSYWFSAKTSFLPSEFLTEDNVLIRGAYLGGLCNRPSKWEFDLIGALCQVGASTSVLVIMIIAVVGVFKMLMLENLPSFGVNRVKHIVTVHKAFEKSA